MQHPELPVVTTPGKPVAIHPSTISRTHAKVVKQAGLPAMPLHGVRHLHGSFLVSAGESLKAVSTRLGHASAAFTLSVYVRDLPGEQQRVAETFAKVMGQEEATGL